MKSITEKPENVSEIVFRDENGAEWGILFCKMDFENGKLNYDFCNGKPLNYCPIFKTYHCTEIFARKCQCYDGYIIGNYLLKPLKKHLVNYYPEGEIKWRYKYDKDITT